MLLLRERFSAFLNTRHKSNIFPDISHLFYKNVIDDINEYILQLFRWLSWRYIVVQSYQFLSLALASDFFCVQLIQTFVYRDDKSGWTRLISSMYFCYFVIICSWKRAGPFNWTNLKTLHPRMHCAKFGWILPSGSEEEFFKCCYVFLLICYYLPLEKERTFHSNKLESHSSKDALCQVWLKFA